MLASALPVQMKQLTTALSTRYCLRIKRETERKARRIGNGNKDRQTDRQTDKTEGRKEETKKENGSCSFSSIYEK